MLRLGEFLNRLFRRTSKHEGPSAPRTELVPTGTKLSQEKHPDVQTVTVHVKRNEFECPPECLHSLLWFQIFDRACDLLKTAILLYFFSQAPHLIEEYSKRKNPCKEVAPIDATTNDTPPSPYSALDNENAARHRRDQPISQPALD